MCVSRLCNKAGAGASGTGSSGGAVDVDAGTEDGGAVGVDVPGGRGAGVEDVPSGAGAEDVPAGAGVEDVPASASSAPRRPDVVALLPGRRAISCRITIRKQF